MVAAGVVVAGCASVDGDPLATTTGPVITETSGNPWDLPIEQRPALFDPCAEIPVEAVEQGVGGAVWNVEAYTRHQPGELMSCGWKNSELHLSLLSTWKSRAEYLADKSFAVQDAQAKVGARTGLRLSEKNDSFDTTCLQLFFTSHGTVWVSLDLVGGLSTFRGRQLVKSCDALHEVILPILAYIPEGNF